MMKRLLGSKPIWLLVIAIVVFIAFKPNADESDKKAVVAPLESTYHDHLVIHYEGTGQIRPIAEYFLSVNRGGKLDKVRVRQGEPVTKGQVLAVVDEKTRSARLEQALSSFQLAQSEQARVRRLQQAGAATMQELDEANTNFIGRRSDLQTARQELEDAVIRAPADGVLSFFAFQLGDYIPDGSRVAALEDHSRYQIITKIPFHQAEQITQVEKVSLAYFDVVSRTEASEWVETTASVRVLREATLFDSAGIDVLLEIDPEEVPFKVGDPVMLRIPVMQFDEVTVLPLEALIEEESQSPVVGVDDGSGSVTLMSVDLQHRRQGDAIVRGLPPHAVVLPKTDHLIKEAQLKHAANKNKSKRQL